MREGRKGQPLTLETAQLGSRHDQTLMFTPYAYAIYTERMHPNDLYARGGSPRLPVGRAEAMRPTAVKGYLTLHLSCWLPENSKATTGFAVCGRSTLRCRCCETSDVCRHTRDCEWESPIGILVNRCASASPARFDWSM